jgi:hypothetical protein
MSKLKDGYATGRIHGNLMEVSCHVADHAGIIGLVGVVGSRWVPLDPDAECLLPGARRTVRLGWVMTQRSLGLDPLASVQRNEAIDAASAIPNRALPSGGHPTRETTKAEQEALIKRFLQTPPKEDAKGEKISEFAGFSIYGPSGRNKILSLDTQGRVKLTLPPSRPGVTLKVSSSPRDA